MTHGMMLFVVLCVSVSFSMGMIGGMLFLRWYIKKEVNSRRIREMDLLKKRIELMKHLEKMQKSLEDLSYYARIAKEIDDLTGSKGQGEK